MSEGTKEVTTAATPVDEVADKLKAFGANDETVKKIKDELGVETLEDLKDLEAEDLTKAGMKVVKARQLLKDLTAMPASTATTMNADANTGAMQYQIETLLPVVPDDESWLGSLKSGGVLKTEDSSYISAVRAALADRVGLFDIPAKLVEKMEAFAEENAEPVGSEFFGLRKQLVRRSYADIFSAVDGLDGSFITDKRRKDFITRMNKILWPAIVDSYKALDSWYNSWLATCSNPQMIIMALGGNSAGINNMMAAPDVTALHSAGDSLIDAINQVFGGIGVQVAAAMAYDANQIRSTLDNPKLPSLIGANNREQMLKKLGVNVSSSYIYLEKNLVRYVLAFVHHGDVTSDMATSYFAALWQLGSQIPDLGISKRTINSVTGDQIL